jgi:hypothetical protein
MPRAEDLRSVRRFLEDQRYAIDMQLMELDTMIRRSEHATPALSPGRRKDDLPHSDAPKVELSAPVLLGAAEECPEPAPVTVPLFDDYHGEFTGHPV